MALLGTSEEEINNGACSTLSGDEKTSILESNLFGSCDRQLLIAIGAIPMRESSATLLGWRPNTSFSNDRFV
jgi:hypothetical protein